jgi:cysteinyl-tRNA synthetase
MHNGFLNIDNEKMSKSLGNFFTTREVLAKIKHPEVLRFFLLSSHYRGPMNYSPPQLEQSEAALTRLYLSLRDMPALGGEQYAPTGATAGFTAAMDDDLNTPEAIAVLQGLARELNTERVAHGDGARARQIALELRGLGGVLGLLAEDTGKFLRSAANVAMRADGVPAVHEPGDAEIEALIEARIEARKSKNWPESDRIRDALVAVGVILEDKPGGVTEWRRE